MYCFPDFVLVDCMCSLVSHVFKDDYFELFVKQFIDLYFFFFSFNNNCIFLSCTTWWFDIHIHSEMITTVKLNNSHLLTELPFLCMVKAPEIYSLSIFPVFSTVLLTIVIMLYIRYLDLSIYITETLYPFTDISPFPSSPIPHNSTLFLWFQLFQITHVSEIMQYMSCCTWLIISLIIMSSRFIYAIMNDKISFYFNAE